MHLTQEHTPTPNATAGLRPTGNFLHLCEQRKSLLPARRWAQGRRGFRGPGRAAHAPEGTEPEDCANPSLYITSAVSPPSGAPIGVTITSVAAVCGSLSTWQAAC